ncbi:hypothetical protein [Pedobacter mendelii]|uniref:Uncharacterized protein n=1 Tax=Pedobacter mendelii TaxID=1908240 RepID=A0ABQ2BI47_9SPHI|nr:hypothetical protein [Pedobacter mendelii]GGI24743.1 hypothetical protein GCM10008119_14180 [Pedobacter mendelii]
MREQEYWITNSEENKIKDEFFCFADPRELRDKIDQTLTKEHYKWEELDTNEEDLFYECHYKSNEADLKIEICKPDKLKPYLLSIKVLGGTDPLKEISKLCKVNMWSACNTSSLEYLDLAKTQTCSIIEEDKENERKNYWEEFNKAQEEEEQRKVDLEEDKENRSYNDNSIETEFYKTPFGKVIFEEISNNKELLSLKKLINFPYDDFQKLKNDVKKGTSKVLSFYKYKLLKGINKDIKSMLYHDVTIFMPNLIILISIILAIFLKDWTFLLILPIKFIIGRLTTNSNDKPYLKYLAFTVFIASIYLFYLGHINISIIVLLSGVLLSSVLIARHQFNSAMTNLALINEEIFCYLIITDHIWLKTKNDLYIYSAVKRANDMINSWEIDGKL